MGIFYFLIAIFTSTIGSLTGMGGGVLAKPFLDFLGHFDAGSISVLSSISVFAMAITSVIKQYLNKTKLDMNIVLPLATGSAIGGSSGQIMFNAVKDSSENPNFILILQNAILGFLLIIVYYYMTHKEKFPSRGYTSPYIAIFSGVILGICSSFLGIGGGPMNVAVFVYFFSYDTKTSAISSVVAIFFSQITKLFAVAVSTGFSEFDLSVASYMIVGSIAGGLLGSKLAINFSSEQIEKYFNATQILIISLCIINIFLLLS